MTGCKEGFIPDLDSKEGTGRVSYGRVNKKDGLRDE